MERLGAYPDIAFIGRTDERAALADAFFQDRRGCRIVLLIGESGIGKTRFFQETIPEFAASGAVVFVGSALDFVSEPFAVLRDALRVDAQTPVNLQGFLVHLLTLLSAFSEMTLDSDRLRRERMKRFADVVEAFEALCNEASIVMVLEDIHWADSATLELLRHMQRKMRTGRLLIVASVRSEVLAQAGECAANIAKLLREGAERIDLLPFDPAEVQAFFSAVPASDHLDPARRSRIEQLAEGRPLYLREMIRSSNVSPSDIPSTLRAIVLERLPRFSDDERQVLFYAATLGRQFDASLLSSLVEVSKEVVISALRSAVQVGILAELGAPRGQFTFTHALVRDVIYNDLPAILAKDVHKRVAIALHAENLDHMQGEIAYHAWAGGLRDLAMQANLRCARRAMQLHTYTEAATLFTRSLECTEETAPEFVPNAIALCRLRFVLGDAHESRLWGERAIAVMRDAPESRDLAYVILVLAGFYATDGKSELAVSYIDRAMGIARAIHDEKLEREAYISRGSLHALFGENSEALRAFEDAGRYDDDTDIRFTTRFHLYRAMARANDGQIDGALHDYARATHYAEEAEEPDWIASCLCNWGSRTCAIGDLETSEGLYRRALAISRENDLAFCRGLASAGLAFVCLLLGNLAEANELLHSEVTKSTTFIARVYANAVALHLAILNGTDASIAELIDDGLKDEVFASNQSQLIGVWAGAVASAYAELGNFQACDELCSSAIEAMESIESAVWLCNTVASRATKPETIERARHLLERAASVDRDMASKVTFEFFCAGVLARNRRARDAKNLASVAAGHFAELSWPIHRALALELAGQSDEALAIYRSINATRCVTRIERINKKFRGRSGPLTGREMQIARHIASGMSNAEISRSLNISERTVESHVASIFARLNVRTRAQVAAHIARTNVEISPPLNAPPKSRLAVSAATRGRELVRAVALLLSSDADLARLYPQVGTLLAGYIDAQTVLIATGTEEKLQCDYLRLDGIDGLPESRDIPENSTTARVMRTCESVVYASAREWPTRKLFTVDGRKSPPQSGLFVPIQFGGRSVGVLSVQSNIRDAYTADDLSILETCALYIGSRLATQRRAEESERFEHLAHTDSLTGLPNRRLFEEALEREWSRASRSGEPVSIAMVDIDHFKSFNDTYGHLAGDSALCQVAASFRTVVERASDIVARFGGEEFVVLLPGTDVAGTLKLAQRLRFAVQDLGIPHAASTFGVLTVSIGFYTVHHVRDVESSVAIQCADQSLYRAKEAGRNCVDMTTFHDI